MTTTTQQLAELVAGQLGLATQARDDAAAAVVACAIEGDNPEFFALVAAEAQMKVDYWQRARTDAPEAVLRRAIKDATEPAGIDPRLEGRQRRAAKAFIRIYTALLDDAGMEDAALANVVIEALTA